MLGSHLSKFKFSVINKTLRHAQNELSVLDCTRVKTREGKLWALLFDYTPYVKMLDPKLTIIIHITFNHQYNCDSVAKIQ